MNVSKLLRLNICDRIFSFGSPTGGPMEWVSYGSARMSLTKVDIFGFAPTDSGNGTYIENYVMRTGHRFRYVYPNFYLNDLCCLEFEGVLLYALCDPFRSISIEHGNEWFEPLTFVAPKNKVFKEKLSEEQWRELSHNYKKHDCTEPTIRNGCDDDSDMNINKGGESD